MGVIVCAYAGSGKTHFCNNNSDCIDFDSKWFVKQEGWEEMYIEFARALTSK